MIFSVDVDLKQNNLMTKELFFQFDRWYQHLHAKWQQTKREAKSDGFCYLNFYFWTVLGHGSLEKYTLIQVKNFLWVSNFAQGWWNSIKWLLLNDEIQGVFCNVYFIHFRNCFLGIKPCYEGETFEVDTKEILNNRQSRVR